MTKEEIAQNEQFLLLLQCFPLFVIGYPFNYRDFLFSDQSCLLQICFVGKQPVAWEYCYVEYWCEKTRKCMSRWTGRRDITTKLLKTALNPNQSINQCCRFVVCGKGLNCSIELDLIDVDYINIYKIWCNSLWLHLKIPVKGLVTVRNCFGLGPTLSAPMAILRFLQIKLISGESACNELVHLKSALFYS